MTQFSDVYDLFLGGIVSDYKIDAVYATSGSMTGEAYIEPFLIYSVDEFDSVCDQDLTYTEATDDVAGYFTETLTIKNKLMLALIMSKWHLLKNINNSLAMRNILGDKDFRRSSEANNLSSRRMTFNKLSEEIAEKLTLYEYSNNSWSSWRDQTFY